MKKERRIDLDLIRSIAIICVITVHGLYNIGFYNITNGSISLFIGHIIRNLTIICVPLFLILTGYLNGKKEIKLNKDYFLKPTNLIIIYLISGIICSIPKIFLKTKLSKIIISFFTFEAAPYGWYLAMYLGLFLLIPILNLSYKKIKEYDEKYLKYLLFILILLVSIPTVFNNFDLSNSNWWYGTSKKYTELLPDFWIQLYPILYYYIGLFISDYKIVIKNKKKYILYIIITTLLFTLINYFKNIGNIFSWDCQTNYYGYQALITSILIFTIIIGINFKNKIIKSIISIVAKYSFGIYMISYIFDKSWYHVIEHFIKNYNQKLLILPISCFVIIFCSLLASISITKVSDKITLSLKKIILKKEVYHNE